MKVPWSGDKCVLCLDGALLTKEHIIPASLGGALTCAFLCKTCNSNVGAYVESEAKTDPSIRLAVDRLKSAFPNLAKQLMDRQYFISHGPGGRERGTVKSGKFRTMYNKKEDGSIIRTADDARNDIQRILRKSGATEQDVKIVLGNFDESPENIEFYIDELKFIKWSIERIEPDISNSNLLNPLVPLKIAYEFLCLHLGSAAYDDAKQMSDLRMVLQKRIESHPCYAVDRLCASQYKPCHGIIFEGNDPYAKVQIRLFGWLVFRVHFKNLAVDGRRFVYTHLLDLNKEYFHLVTSETNAP